MAINKFYRTGYCQFIVKYLYWPYRLGFMSSLRAVGSEDKSGQVQPVTTIANKSTQQINQLVTVYGNNNSVGDRNIK